ncbi:MAG: TonB-dependent receptor, partial [Bacteroidota bacterium]
TFFDGKVQGNLSFFEIKQRNVLVGDPFEDPGNYSLESLTTVGEQRSNGVEWDVSGYVLPNLQILASYAFTNAEILQHGDEQMIGERIGGAPEHSANFWGKYDFTTDLINGISIGFGIQYSGDKYSWYNYSFSERLLLPEYTVLDGAVYYKPTNSDLQLILKVNNLTNKTYWAGALNQFRLAPGAPRNVLLTATYKF